MAPPKMLSLGPPLKTRATNKDKHPGAPDMLKGRRKPAEMKQIRQDTAKKEQETRDVQKRAVNDVAEIEDRLQHEDEDRENQRMRRYNTSLGENS
jgi:hypothetical protein